MSKMSKINKIDRMTFWLLSITIIVHISLFIINLFSFFKEVPMSKAFDIKDGVFYYLVCFIIQSLLAVVISILILKFLKAINNKDIFNSLNIDYIFHSSMFLIVYIAIENIKSIVDIEPNDIELLSTTPYTSTLLIMIAIVMQHFVFIYKESKSIKEENDLTI